MRQRLKAAQVAELAELFADAPRRTGVIDAVLQAAAEGRGMTLVLADGPGDRSRPRRRSQAGGGVTPAGGNDRAG